MQVTLLLLQIDVPGRPANGPRFAFCQLPASADSCIVIRASGWGIDRYQALDVPGLYRFIEETPSFRPE